SAAPLTKAKPLFKSNWAVSSSGWEIGGDGTWSARGGTLTGIEAKGEVQGGSTLIAPFVGRTGRYSVQVNLRLAQWMNKDFSGYGILIRSNGPQDPSNSDTLGIVGGPLVLLSGLSPEAAI